MATAAKRLKAPEQVGVRELKNHLSEHLRRVRGGRELIITDRGKVVARLVPAPEPPAWLRKMIAEGKVSWGGGPKPRGLRGVRLRGKGPTAAEIVIQQRG
jgi:prevent-host-death family protein